MAKYLRYLILWESFPACVLCVRLVCPAGSRGLLKLSQHGRSWQPGRCWQAGRDWERYWGICFFWRILVFQQTGQRRYFYFRITVPEAVAFLDNSYRICYNKCNDDNKNVICHQTGKNGPGKRFRVYPYKIPMSRQKRRTAHLHKLW